MTREVHWIRLDDHPLGTSEARAAAARLVDTAAAASLPSGGYRWKDSAGYYERLLILADGDEPAAVALHYLERNDDPEIAAAAGPTAICVPMLVARPGHSPGAAAGVITRLAERLRAIHGEHRITLSMPVGEPHWHGALASGGFRADSALSVRSGPAPTRPPSQPDCTIRAAERDDAAAVATLFAESLTTLAKASPFVRFDAAAVEAVRSRISTCEAGLTADQSRVWVAEDAAGTVLGAIEARRETTPDDYAVARAPLGPTGCIDWIAVKASHQGLGLGLHLVEHTNHHLTRTGATNTYTHHLLGPDGPEGFWRRAGFNPAWSTWELAPADHPGAL
ncbi:hypothetical protein ATKI12_8857 [Kitasatospora sp. Ki12]